MIAVMSIDCTFLNKIRYLMSKHCNTDSALSRNYISNSVTAALSPWPQDNVTWGGKMSHRVLSLCNTISLRVEQIITALCNYMKTVSVM